MNRRLDGRNFAAERSRDLSAHRRGADLAPAPAAGGQAASRRSRAETGSIVASQMVQVGLFGFGILALSLCGLCQIHSALYQHFQSQKFEDALRKSISGWHSSGGAKDASASSYVRRHGRLDRGDPVGRIEIPRVGINAMIGEGVDSSTLMVAVGHQMGSAFPGEPGNVVLAAHRDSFFRKLKGIENGDTIRVTTLDGTFTYHVIGIAVVSPSTTEVLEPTKAPALTLVTCYPFQWIGQAPLRYIVRGKLVGPDDAGGASASAHAGAGTSDGATLPSLPHAVRAIR